MLQAVQQHYHFHILHHVPLNEELHLQTNCGTKKVVVWTDEQALHWSFLWREEAATGGIRTVDRFIRTKDGAPFVSLGDSYLTVQDLPYGNQLNIHHNTHRLQASKLLARIYSNFRTLSQKLASSDGFQMMHHPPSAKPSTITDQEQKRNALKKKITLQRESAFMYAVRCSWKQIDRRWKQSLQLLASSSPSFFAFNLLKWEWFWQSSPDTVHVSVEENNIGNRFSALVSFWKEFLLSSVLTVNEVGEMIDIFLFESGVTRAERLSILAELIHPDPFITLIQHYFERRWSEEECLEAWMDACVKQEIIDQLTQWYAERLDMAGKDVMAR